MPVTYPKSAIRNPQSLGTIPELFSQQASRYAQKVLFFVKRQGRFQPILWQQAQEEVNAFASWLLLQRVQVGDRILLLSENRPEWAIADIAIQSIGAWTVPIYPSLIAGDIQAICSDAQPVICIASNLDQAAKCHAVTAQVPSIRTCVIFDAATLESFSQPSCLWADILTRGRQELSGHQEILEQRRTHLQPDDVATLIYTSGTTGEPKGVMLSHRNFLSNVEACLSVIPISEMDLHLSFLPLSHVFERMAGWYLILAAGASIAYAETMESVPQNILETQPTIMLGVPRFFEKLHTRIQEQIQQSSSRKRRIAEWALRIGEAHASRTLQGETILPDLALKRLIASTLVYKSIRARLGGRLRFFVSGSAPLQKTIGEFFYSIGITILEGYGLTETSPVIAVNRLPKPRFGSVGKVLPDLEVKIAEDGEILTRGPHVMRGYYQKSEQTKAAIVEGWFRTGDIGHLDVEGYLWITDRKKDLIKTAGGKFVAPQKLENLFMRDPFISQVFVYGDRRPYCVALIVPNMTQLKRYVEEQKILAPSIQEMVNNTQIQNFYWNRIQTLQQSLPGFEQIKRIALLDHEFSQVAGELTPTLKVKRNIIAQRYEKLLQQLYA